MQNSIDRVRKRRVACTAGAPAPTESYHPHLPRRNFVSHLPEVLNWDHNLQTRSKVHAITTTALPHTSIRNEGDARFGMFPCMQSMLIVMTPPLRFAHAQVLMNRAANHHRLTVVVKHPA